MTSGLNVAVLAAGIALAIPAFAQSAQTFESSAGDIRVERMAEGLENPWAFAFLPEPGRILVTEIDGRMRIVDDGLVGPPLDGVPEVRARGQGGLLDVVLAPEFETTREIYFSFSEPTDDGGAHTALARARLAEDGGALTGVQVIFRQTPSGGGGRHFGSRIVFNDDGTLFLTLGDRGQRDRVQDLGNHFGKVVRLNRDGSVPADNPFIGRDDVLPEIWSYGHRNAQGAASDADGTYYTISHGARGGDEVNQPRAGLNYGWADVSYGTHYSGRSFPTASREGTEQPLFYWDPSIAPSGAAFYDGDRFPAWRGDLFVGSLKFGLISRLDMEDGEIVGEERLMDGAFGRVRDVRIGPDGAIWFATDRSDGGLYRIVPAE
ncbi:MAG: PQQ-dependent sugar dehydrogenase [Alphaproteobacteria bacterium]|nr:PQQ-dependent sugar dehydrogenase [Alphaproteobacteria bacterium]